MVSNARVSRIVRAQQRKYILERKLDRIYRAVFYGESPEDTKRVMRARAR